jgi:hypothetical protein
MKLPLPSVRDVERIMKLVPVFKNILPDKGNSAESSLLNIIKQKDDALHDKKADICKLRERIIELEQTLTITEDELRDTEVRLRQAGGL